MHYDALKNDHGLRYDPVKAIVAPRPIGWISTLNPEGGVNLAPYSFFNLVSYQPHYVMFSSEGRKDSLRNAERQKQFVCSLATAELWDELNRTGASVPADVDEMQLAQLQPAPSRQVSPPRVKRSPAALECLYHNTVELPADDASQDSYFMVIGKVVGIYLDDDFIEDGLFRLDKTKALGRLGYYDYTVVDQLRNSA